jgi:class 3 adenylate cyclase
MNSWGDAIQVVLSDVVSAGHCAVDLQEANQAIDHAAAGLPPDLDLRVGLHVGPLLELRDPFRDTPGWWGREITRAARIEPRTPRGEVYATDAFAALLALEPGSGLQTEYVGRVTTAKDFETIPMYRVSRTGSQLFVAPQRG